MSSCGRRIWHDSGAVSVLSPEPESRFESSSASAEAFDEFPGALPEVVPSLLSFQGRTDGAD